MDIRALLYVPESRPGMFETARDAESGVALYCRKVPCFDLSHMRSLF